MDTELQNLKGNMHSETVDNQVAVEAEITIEALQKKNQELEQELFDMRIELQAVTDEFESAYLETEKARKELERANNVKSAFLASMSHELRTPLNAIINFTKFLQKGKMGPVTEQQSDALDKVKTSGIHLLNLINDVLDITKIESGSMSLLVEPSVQISELVNRAIVFTEGLLEGKLVSINVNVPPLLPTMVGDRQRILQILINILSNACKFTETGTISIRAYADEKDIHIHVTDTGPGIALEDQDAVFETFRQTQAGLRAGNGTGLGMPISKRLAEAHGGKLLLQSEVNVGSTFKLILPIKSDILEPNFA